MNTAIVVLHALKDTCGLHCLVALHLAGPRPVTQQTLMSLTGFDDAAVHRGLHKLLALGLVTCAGRKHLTAWELTPAAATLPLRLAPPAPPAPPAAPEPPAPSRGFPNRESDAPRVVVVEKEQRDTHILSTLPARSQATTTGRRPATAPSRQPARASPPPPASRPPPTDPHIAQLQQVFSHANVWPGGRAELAQALAAADGPRWVRQSLAWLCYAVRECAHMQVGAVVYPALRDRVDPAPEHLPPEELDFAAALQWALRGGREAGEYANELEGEPAEAAEPDEQAAPRDAARPTADAEPQPERRPAPDASQPPARLAPEPPAPAARASPDPLLAELLADLQAESAPGTRAHVDFWLRGARLEPTGPAAWRLTVRAPLVRDWVNNRLRQRLAGMLARRLRQPVNLAVEVDALPP
jgi:hypothetical protein